MKNLIFVIIDGKGPCSLGDTLLVEQIVLNFLRELNNHLKYLTQKIENMKYIFLIFTIFLILFLIKSSIVTD